MLDASLQNSSTLLCRSVLRELATGNPNYQQQVYKAMIALLKSVSPDAQQIAAQLLQVKN